MKKLIYLSLSLLVFVSSTPKMKAVKMVDGITVLMPKDFVQMNDDDLSNKYPSTKKPVAFYTNLDRTVDFGLNISKSKWGGADLTILKDVFHATIVESYDTVQFINEDIVDVNGRPYIRYEYTSSFDNVQAYNYMMISILVKTLNESEVDKEKLMPGNARHMLIFNFSAPLHLKEKYQTTAHAMMQSIVVNTNKASKSIPEVANPEVKGLNSKQTLEQQNAKKKSNSSKK